MAVEQTHCACGRLLHYTDPAVEEVMMRIVKEKGENVIIDCGGEKYSVQRHFIALHGVRGLDLTLLEKAGIINHVQV